MSYRSNRPEGILARRKSKGHAPSEEYWRAKQLELWHLRYEKLGDQINEKQREKRKTDPELREKWNEAKRQYYYANTEKYAERKRKWRKDNNNHYRETWNAWYQRIKHTKRGEQLASRIKYRPLYGLKGALSKFENGTIGIDELTRLYDAALARVNDVGSGGSKKQSG